MCLMQAAVGKDMPWASLPLDVTLIGALSSVQTPATANLLLQGTMLSQQAAALRHADAFQAWMKLAADGAAAAVAASSASVLQQSSWRYFNPQVCPGWCCSAVIFAEFQPDLPAYPAHALQNPSAMHPHAAASWASCMSDDALLVHASRWSTALMLFALDCRSER